MDQILAEETVDGGSDETVPWTLTDHLNTVRDVTQYDPDDDMTRVVNDPICDVSARVLSCLYEPVMNHWGNQRNTAHHNLPRVLAVIDGDLHFRRRARRAR